MKYIILFLTLLSSCAITMPASQIKNCQMRCDPHGGLDNLTFSFLEDQYACNCKNTTTYNYPLPHRYVQRTPIGVKRRLPTPIQ